MKETYRPGHKIFDTLGSGSHRSSRPVAESGQSADLLHRCADPPRQRLAPVPHGRTHALVLAVVSDALSVQLGDSRPSRPSAATHRLQEITVEQGRKRLVLRPQAPGCAGSVFKAVSVALPPLARSLPPATPAPIADPPLPPKRCGRPRRGATAPEFPEFAFSLNHFQNHAVQLESGGPCGWFARLFPVPRGQFVQAALRSWRDAGKDVGEPDKRVNLVAARDVKWIRPVGLNL